MLVMISPWAESTDLACSVHDLDEQSCLEGKKRSSGKRKGCVELGRETAASPPGDPRAGWGRLCPLLSTLGFEAMSSEATGVLLAAVKLMRNVPWMGAGAG